MSVTITPSPAINGYITTDQQITLTAGTVVIWDSVGNILTTRIGNTAKTKSTIDSATYSFVPKSTDSSIQVYVPVSASVGTGGNFILSGNCTFASDIFTAPSTLGSTPWASYALGVSTELGKTPSQAKHFFLDLVVNSDKKNMLFGFTNSTTFSGLTDLQSGFILRDDGKYHIVSGGQIADTRMLWYKKDDVFRVYREDKVIRYTQNGETIHKEVFNYPSNPVFLPILAFNSASASVKTVNLYFSSANGHDGNYGTFGPIKIYSVCPGQPQYSYKINRDNITLGSQAEDGTMVLRKKSRGRMTMSLQYNQRPYEEFKEILDFYNHHEKHIPFIYRDIGPYETDEHTEYLVRFDNQLEYTIEGPNSVTWSLALREV